MLSTSLKVLALLAILSGSQCATAQWVFTGKEAMYTMYLPQAKQPDTHALFIISYEQRWACKPSVSVMLMSGRKLGSPTKQATEKNPKDQLHIIVDGRVFRSETKITMYTNGIEMAMFAPKGLIEAMEKNPSSVIARVGSDMGGFDFSGATGFSAANSSARKNCS